VFLICEIVGPPLGGYLAQASGYRTLFGAAVAFMVVATALRVWNAWDVPPRLEALKVHTLKTGLGGIGALILGGGLLTWIFVVDAARDMGFALTWELRPLFLKDLGGLADSQIGWLSSLSAVFMALLMTPGGTLSDRVGERKVMVVGGLVEVAAVLVFVNAGSMAGFALSAVLLSAAWALFGPAFNSLLSKAVPTSQLGLTYGLFETTLSLLAMPAPWIGANVWHAVSPQLPFYLTAGVALATRSLIWFTFRPPALVEVPPGRDGVPADILPTES
jgi:MFS family permease